MIRNSLKQSNPTVLLFLILMLSTACATSKQPAPTMAAPVKPTASLSVTERVEIFEEVWQTINVEYYDSSFHGVDWRKVHERYRPLVEAAASNLEFYRLFEVMLAELRDAHTVFNAPRSSDEQAAQPIGSVGISLQEVEGQTAIVTVEPDSDAARAGVRPGMILRAVNGKPVEQLYAEIRSRFAGSSSERAMKNVMHGALLYGGFLGASRTFAIERFDGSLFDVSITHHGASSMPTALTARRLPSGDGYIKFNGWQPPLDAQFRTELEKLSDTDGLVIDLRGNGGGQTDVLLNIGSLFFPTEHSFGGFKRRGGKPEKIVTHKPEQLYRGAVVILVDEISASASEVFTVSMQEHARARVIGQQTCGCVLNQWSKNLKGGATLRWSARVYSSPEGRILEGTGVIPDETVALTISDLRQGRDAALELAEHTLRHRQMVHVAGRL